MLKRDASERVLRAAKNAGEDVGEMCDRELERGFQFLLLADDVCPESRLPATR